MTYNQTLAYLFSQLPMLHRIGAAAYKADLSNTIALCHIMGNPERNIRSVHIAGTNGKGSTSHLIASVLQEAGYKTGLFTSPHLKDFRERIKINGQMISKCDVMLFVKKHKKDFDQVKPSFFEWTFALATWYFNRQKVDIAVFETGMGGRLDSTNVITPLISVITNIGMDHTRFLGNTLTEIANEKAGIIKRGIPVVIGETHPETEPVFKNFSMKNKSEIAFADHQVKLQHLHRTRHRTPLLTSEFRSLHTGEVYRLTTPLSGKYQIKNTATALSALEKLRECELDLSNDIIRKGFRNVVKNTGLKGRWQVLSNKPLTIADIGHNPDGIREILEQLEITPHNKLHFVIGVVNDKDSDTMLSMLPQNAVYYFCKANIPRGLDANELAMQAKKYKLHGKAYPTVSEAIVDAKSQASGSDLVLIAGSAFVVAEAL